MDTLRILTCRSRIKHLITLLVLLPLPAWVQSGTTFHVQTNIIFFPVLGSSDASWTLKGPGVSLNAAGDALCDWCTDNSAFEAGSSLNPSISLVDFCPGCGGGTVTLGGQQFNCQLAVNCSLTGTGISALGSFTFPTNRQTFTVTVPAELQGPISGQVGPQLLPFNLQTPRGELTLTFFFRNFLFPSYAFERGTFSTPEPGTLDLMMAAALAGVLGVVLRRRKLPRHSH